MFTFYCIIFRKLSKINQGNCLCLMPCLCVIISLLRNNVWHTQLSKKILGAQSPVIGVLPLDPTGAGAMSPWIGPAMDNVGKRAGYRQRKIYCLGGNFKVSGYGLISDINQGVSCVYSIEVDSSGFIVRFRKYYCVQNVNPKPFLHLSSLLWSYEQLFVVKIGTEI